ncbi:MFS transporter [Micromonospora sp. NPDC049559]|uniref:MFS transporter n=1 Tax=Micromonospora sp. NPDC049559 TaxID=3155923 RepID=UPI00343EBDC7
MRQALRSRAIRTFAVTQFLLEVQFWFPVWLIYLLDLGFPLTTAVLADGVFRIVSVACEFPLGVVGDLLGRRRTYLALAGATIVTYAAITQIHSVGVLFGVWVLWGVQWALGSGAASTYLYELCAVQQPQVDPAKAFGLVRAVGNVAVLLSLLAAGYLYDVDPRLPFAITAGLAVVAFLLALTLPEVARPRVVPTLGALVADVRAVAADPRVRRVVWLGALLLLFGWSARILFQPLALELGLSPEVTGWMYAVFAAASVAGGLAAGYLATRRRAALTVVFVLLLVPLVATARLTWLGPFLFLPILGFAYALGTTVLEVLTNEVTPRAVRGMVFGLVTCLGGIGIAVARPGLGVVADQRSVAFGFALWAAIGIPVLALAAPAIRRLRPGRPPAPAVPPLDEPSGAARP